MNPSAFVCHAHERVAAISGAVLAILARLVIGQAFIQTGLGKLGHHAATTESFTGWGIPLPGLHAWMVGGLELVGGALLILGLATRASAFLLLGTMTVAILTAHRAEFLAAVAINPDDGLTGIPPVMFGLALLALLAHGAGWLSLDRLLSRRCASPAASDRDAR